MHSAQLGFIRADFAQQLRFLGDVADDRRHFVGARAHDTRLEIAELAFHGQFVFEHLQHPTIEGGRDARHPELCRGGRVHLGHLLADEAGRIRDQQRTPHARAIVVGAIAADAQHQVGQSFDERSVAALAARQLDLSGLHRRDVRQRADVAAFRRAIGCNRPRLVEHPNRAAIGAHDAVFALELTTATQGLL